MKPYYQDDAVTLYHSDCLIALQSLDDNSVDSIVTDPPYGLAFMGKKWDYDVPSVEIWAECLRVLKPGGHLLAFAGTRTQHRMAVRIEDAGFEIRDMIFWCYGSGFPKSLDIGKAIDKAAGAERESIPNPLASKQTCSIATNAYGDFNATTHISPIPATEAAKQWDGWGSALKPALEPITMARKPLDGTIAGNVLKHGVGGINVDGCRVGTTDKLGGGMVSMGRPKVSEGWDRPWMHDPEVTERKKAESAAKVAAAEALGRFPANFCHDGSDEVVGLFPETGASSASNRGLQHSGRHGGLSDIGGNIKDGTDSVRGHDDNGGSAARFFYCAKADSRERRNSKHPTTKPLDLMRYLVRLVTPIGATVLDPFMGSGTTIEAARLESCKSIGMEREAEYCADATKRLSQGVLF